MPVDASVPRRRVHGHAANVDLVRYEMARRDASYRVVAERSGVSQVALARLLRGEPVYASTVRKIAKALKAMPIVDGGLLAKPGEPIQIEDN